MSNVVLLSYIDKIYQTEDVTFQALRNINLTIKEGEFVAIIGASGSGKSTLMNIIGLLDQPTSGQYQLDGEDTAHLAESELAQIRNNKIGFVFQSFNLLRRTSALDNVALPLIYAKVSATERQERAKRALERVGLGDKLQSRSSQLSGGQQQRVAIARALVNNPDLILADEPTGNLDTNSGVEIMKIFHELNKEGKTIVMITHEDDIAKNAKRIIRIKDGEITHQAVSVWQNITMNLIETIKLSFASILANRMRSFLTVLGIVIGVMSVILLISLVTGLKTFITNQIEGLGSNLLFVIPGRVGGARSPGGVQANRLEYQDAQLLRDKLQSSAQVSAAIQRTGTLKFGNKTDKGAAIYGVEANYSKVLMAIKLESGRFFRESEVSSAKKVAVIGKSAKDTLFGSGSALDQLIDVSGMKYRIIGILEPRGSVFGVDQDNAIYLPLEAATRQFGIDRVNTIYISASNPESVKSIQNQATAILKKRLTEDDFTVQSQEQTLSTIGQITGVLTAALGGIAAISLLVGGIGVMNIMLVSVTERTREIGLRKAIGAKPEDIRNQFLIEALTLSGIGGIIGILLGIGISLIIGQFFTTTVPFWSVALSFGFSMLVGVVFGVAPAIRASRLDPITALRYE